VASPTIDLSGCTSNQTSVARLMARLRAVRGVSRVALVSSAKSPDTTGAAGPVVGGLCGKGAKPTFSVSIYFERFGVPAIGAPAAPAAPGAAATGPTGATGAAATAPGTVATPQAGAATTTAPGTTPVAPSTTAPSTQGVSAP
jgi:hypothetical protein